MAEGHFTRQVDQTREAVQGGKFQQCRAPSVAPKATYGLRDRPRIQAYAGWGLDALMITFELQKRHRDGT